MGLGRRPGELPVRRAGTPRIALPNCLRARGRSRSARLQRALRHAHRARAAVWIRARLEGRHQLLEALSPPLRPSRSIRQPPRTRRSRSRTPSCRGSRAPGISPPDDPPGRGRGRRRSPRGLRRQEHGEAPVAGRRRGPCGRAGSSGRAARRMGDPGLRARRSGRPRRPGPPGCARRPGPSPRRAR